MKMRNIIIAVAAAILPVLAAYGDGMIIPIRPEIRVSGQWAVKYHHVTINVKDQVASVSVDQEFVNTGNGMIEVEYIFPVPPGAAIDSMTLIVDGKEFAAKLYAADEARKMYEEIVRKKKDPALLEYVGFGMYRTKAFPLEPNKPAKVLVNYKMVCEKNAGLVEVWYPLNTEKFSSKSIDDVSITTTIETDSDITAVYSPTHSLKVDRDKNQRRVVATYEEKGAWPTGDFQLFYRAADEEVGATLLSDQPIDGDDGYFMMLVSPNPGKNQKKVVQKDVVLAFDHSGSMSGQKIEQARESLKYILNNLNPGDRFNVISYNDTIDQFFDEPLAPADAKKVEEAVDRVAHIDASGATNIADAVSAAFKCLDKRQGDRPSYVIFMTDGLATAGKTADKDILEIAKASNTNRARLFAFGVGYDVNIRLLDKLVGDNRGSSDYVKPKENIESKISSLYNKIKNPVMTNLSVKLKDVRIRDMYPRKLGDLFDGDQIVVVGRYNASDAKALPERDGKYSTQLVVSGMYDGKERGFEYNVNVSAANWRNAFVEKLWAMRRVGYLLDQIQLNGESKEVIDELVRLSKQYGIMTPYTSFLADERNLAATPAAIHDEMAKSAAGLSATDSGEAGQRSAMARQALNEADKAMSPSYSPGAMAAAEATGGPKAAAAASSAPMVGNTAQGYYEADKKETVANMRQVGNQTLYRKGDTWMTPDASKLDQEKDAAKIKEIERFSDEYFELVRKNTTEQNQIMSSQQPSERLMLELRGQTYLIK